MINVYGARGITVDPRHATLTSRQKIAGWLSHKFRWPLLMRCLNGFFYWDGDKIIIGLPIRVAKFELGALSWYDWCDHSNQFAVQIDYRKDAMEWLRLFCRSSAADPAVYVSRIDRDPATGTAVTC